MARPLASFSPLRGALLSVTCLALGAPLSSCRNPDLDARRAAPIAVATAAPATDVGVACRARAQALLASPALPGAPAYDAARLEILGRARGEPLVLAREPIATPSEDLSPAALASRLAFERGKPGGRVVELARRHRGDPEALRALVLREGYVYSAEPLDALAMVTSLKLVDLFSEPEIWLMRGTDRRQLRRDEPPPRRPGSGLSREITYRYVDGPLSGRTADLLFGDRIATTEAALAAPLHRDVVALADDLGFDRGRIVHQTGEAIVADLRFGNDDRWARAVLDVDGAALRLSCLAEDAPRREAIESHRRAEAPRRRALARIHEVVTEEVHEGFRFDRPEGETGPDRDGQLRPMWMTAYLQGRGAFELEEASYPVFDPEGKAWPPQVCVDFVVDTFERTSGTWFRPRGEKLGRVVGRVDFSDLGVRDVPTEPAGARAAPATTATSNRRGVIGFGKFAEERTDLFEMRRFEGNERIPFKDRSRYFGFLAEHADEVRAGDVVAIQGLKRDDRIHQHAILVERTDPLTGFPYGLADQMKRPRRRTWEGIMAEAPARSLLYRVRMQPSLVARLDPG